MALKSLRSTTPAMRHGLVPPVPGKPGTEGTVRHIARLSRPGQPEAAIPGQIRALPAGITNRVGRFRRIPEAASTYRMAGGYTFTGHGAVPSAMVI